MKTLLTALVIVAIAGSASAATKGPLDVQLFADGTAAIVNNGAMAFQFDGYTLLSAGGLLPADVKGINDNTWLDLVGFPAMLGLTVQEATAFQEMSATATNFSEVTMSTAATLQAGDMINLGGGFAAYGPADGTFTYVDSSLPVGETSFYGDIIPVPEPTTMSLLGLGVLALVRRRR